MPEINIERCYVHRKFYINFLQSDVAMLGVHDLSVTLFGYRKNVGFEFHLESRTFKY